MRRDSLASWWPLVAVTLLLTLVGGAAAVADPQLTSVPQLAATQNRDERNIEEMATADAEPNERGKAAARPALPSWLPVVVWAVLATIVVSGLLAVFWRLLRDRARSRPGKLDDARAAAPGTAPREVADEVVAVVDAGLSDLSDTDLDPRRAVIACWLRLEEIAESVGTVRQVSDTSTDLVTRLLATQVKRVTWRGPANGDTGIDPIVLATFAAIYRRARYATHAVDEQMRGQARSALKQIRRSVAGVA